MSGRLMRRRSLVLGASAWAVAETVAATRAEAADLAAQAELRRQITLSADEGKRLFLLFYASWCGYCRLFERFLADPAAAAIINREFRVAPFRALERSDSQKALQLAGADDLFTRFAKTPAQGLPFFVVLNGEGGPVATSVSPASGRNIGFPLGKGDLDTFEKILTRAAPRITAAELAILRAAALRQRNR
jgi:thiol-disulfide isomerase/thioredoxin